MNRQAKGPNSTRPTSAPRMGANAGRPDIASAPRAGLVSYWRTPIICFLLMLAIWIVFGRTLHHQFVNYDDNYFVSENPVIIQGLTLKGIVWVFTHRVGPDQWLPVTSISQMLDCQFYGLNPGGHHLTNVLLHAVTAICLFLVLRKLTGALWPGAFVAAVFAIHPLRAESVAWVMGRKDVLSGLFFVLAVGAYARYAQKMSGGVDRATSRGSWGQYFGVGLKNRDYCLALLLFTLGLLSKAMLVTLPLVLLLLDYWPLHRITPTSRPWTLNHRLTVRLVVEKIPFGLLAAASCVSTVLAMKNEIVPVEHVALAARIGNALVSYAVYVGQMLWPAGLSVLYPHPGNHLSIWKVGLSALVLLLISVGVARAWRKRPYLLVGWLWYLGMLLPVIGLMQAGNQARADRYTYLPQIGLYIMVAWGVVDLCGCWRYRRAVLRTVAAAFLAGLLVAARIQTSFWRDSVSLWTHTLACTSENPVAHNNLGHALLTEGNFQAAIKHFEQALRLKPDYAEAHNNLGVVLTGLEKSPDAIPHFEQALRLRPGYAEAHNNFGVTLAKLGRLDEAVQHCDRALQLESSYAEAHYNRGNALVAQRKLNEATHDYSQAVRLKPDYAEAHNNFGIALALQGRLDEAIQHYERVLQLKPDYADAHYNLAIALAAQGKLNEAVQHFERALQLKPDNADAHFNLGIALTKRGNVKEAIQHLQAALSLAATQANSALVETIHKWLKSYQLALPQPQAP